MAVQLIVQNFDCDKQDKYVDVITTSALETVSISKKVHASRKVMS